MPTPMNGATIPVQLPAKILFQMPILEISSARNVVIDNKREGGGGGVVLSEGEWGWCKE